MNGQQPYAAADVTSHYRQNKFLNSCGANVEAKRYAESPGMPSPSLGTATVGWQRSYSTTNDSARCDKTVICCTLRKEVRAMRRRRVCANKVCCGDESLWIAHPSRAARLSYAASERCKSLRDLITVGYFQSHAVLRGLHAKSSDDPMRTLSLSVRLSVPCVRRMCPQYSSVLFSDPCRPILR